MLFIPWKKMITICFKATKERKIKKIQKGVVLCFQIRK
ncbi:hypothetical protein EV214_13710 [Marinisporobacter balticus]|uniref:Uncharacterized protein n=1 Tax=Marinisporobacter balticus TaxID=2018667 RepID=A0A4R2KG28_9FIRM|nr:hypothetical protein EV214_13710 [Marinisporobacter balticus]